MLRYWLGLGLWETGDLYRAEREWQRVVELGEGEALLGELQADALYRLGLAHRLLGRVELEIAHFRKAARLHLCLQLTKRAVRCQIEAAWSLLLAGRTAEALPELQAAAAGRKGLDAPGLAIQLGIARALYLSQVGDYESSDRRCLGLLDCPPLQSAQRADIAWILATNALAVGDQTAAELHAAIACEHAFEAWWPPQLERVEQLRKRLTGGGPESSPSSPPA